MAVIIGTDPEGENLKGSEEADIITALDGDDHVNAGDGNDTVYGGGGDDHLNGQGDDDTLYGDAGDDMLDGGKGDDALYGGEGDDRIVGAEGNDDITGGPGDDKLTGSSGEDTFHYSFNFTQGAVFNFDTSWIVEGVTTQSDFANAFEAALREFAVENGLWQDLDGDGLVDVELGQNGGYVSIEGVDPSLFNWITQESFDIVTGTNKKTGDVNTHERTIWTDFTVGTNTASSSDGFDQITGFNLEDDRLAFHTGKTLTITEFDQYFDVMVRDYDNDGEDDTVITLIGQSDFGVALLGKTLDTAQVYNVIDWLA